MPLKKSDLYSSIWASCDALRGGMDAKGIEHGRTGSQMNLDATLINDTTVPLPTLSGQTAIAAVLSDMNAALTALEQPREKTRALKQGMMQELLTGRTRLI
jgi:type I restriction enzyme S subunit